MKICWSNLEDLCLTSNETFRKGTVTYVYKEFCINCGQPHLTEKSRQSNFCGYSCAISGENNPFFGKIPTIENRKKMSVATSINNIGSSNPNYKGGITKSGLTIYMIHIKID